MKDTLEIKIAIQNLKERVRKADRNFDEWIQSDEEWMNPSWQIESCFLQLLSIAEVLGLSELRKMIESEYSEARKSEGGFSAWKTGGPDDEPYPVALGRIRCFIYALEEMFPKEDSTTVTKDLLQIVRDIHYVIADKELFGTTPEDEHDVHLRIEGILKCVFPDLKHKPNLTKQIKNFEPDTAIPSIQTLVEYKFLSRKEDIAKIADQILADTRGYTSKDWTRILYVIYETNRFKTEKDWDQLLRESGVPKTTSVVVLSGEPLERKRASRASKEEKPEPNSDTLR